MKRICYIDVISDRISSFFYIRDMDFAVLCNECVVRCCFQHFIQGGIVQPPAFCLQDVNHSVSIDLSNENVACSSCFIILSVPYAAFKD